MENNPAAAKNIATPADILIELHVHHGEEVRGHVVCNPNTAAEVVSLLA